MCRPSLYFFNSSFGNKASDSNFDRSKAHEQRGGLVRHMAQVWLCCFYYQETSSSSKRGYFTASCGLEQQQQRVRI